MIILYGTSFSGIAQLFPPLSPASSPDEIAAFFVEHKLWIRFGVSGALLSAVLALPFLAAIILRIRRVEGHWGMLSMTQLMAATIFVPALLFPQFFLGVAAYRPEERSAELTQALNDVFWLWFIGIVGTIIIQNLTLAAAAFIDKTDPPTFPRWYGLPQPVGRHPVAAGLRGGRLQRRTPGMGRHLRLLHPRSGPGGLAVLHHRG